MTDPLTGWRILGGMTFEHQYLALLARVVNTGRLRPTGAVLPSSGQFLDAHTLFAPDPIRCDLSAGFPAVTVKRLAFRQVVAELLWFLSGSTNVEDLRAMGCHIWDEWADDDGDVGPSYGHNWRRFGGGDRWRGVDQIRQLVEGILATVDNPRDRTGRRLLLTALNPVSVESAGLYPCHPLAQWDVEDGRLSCSFYQRSADLFLGTPFNLASYALLTHLLASVAGLDVGTLTMHIGNAHVYANHVPQVREMLGRQPHPSPLLSMPMGLDFHAIMAGTHLPSFRHKDTGLPVGLDDFALVGYEHHGALPGEVAV